VIDRERRNKSGPLAAHQVSLLLPDQPGWLTLPGGILLAVCAA
jgi:hypothetical protein